MIQTISELLLALKNTYLSQGELSDTDWGLYTEEIGTFTAGTICYIADLPEITDDYDEIYPEGVPADGGCISGELLNECVSFCLMHEPDADAEKLLSVLNHYLDYDCFPEMIGQLRQPEVILIQPVTDKKVLLKIRKAFGLTQPMGELVSMASHTPCILTDALSLAEARKIIAEYQLDAWVTVKL